MAARTQRGMVLESAAIEEPVKPYEVRRFYSTPIFHGLSAPDMVRRCTSPFQRPYSHRLEDSLFSVRTRAIFTHHSET